jgi:hypothetical protein
VSYLQCFHDDWEVFLLIKKKTFDYFWFSDHWKYGALVWVGGSCFHETELSPVWLL